MDATKVMLICHPRPAYAQGMYSIFKGMDRDEDGVVNFQEFKNHLGLHRPELLHIAASALAALPPLCMRVAMAANKRKQSALFMAGKIQAVYS